MTLAAVVVGDYLDNSDVRLLVIVGQGTGLGFSECYGCVTVAVAVSSVSFERVTVQECLICSVRAGVDRDCYTAGNRVAFKGKVEVVRCG